MTPEEFAAGAALFLVVCIAIGFAFAAFWVWTVIHCARKCPPSDRLTWLLIVLFVPILGAVLYWPLRPKPPRH